MIEIIRKQFNLFGFEPAETPVIEYREFVIEKNKNNGEVRRIFSLQDRAERKLALRFEFTSQLKRIAKNQKLPYKRYQIGYNFIDEPIKEGKPRQLIQCDADTMGSTLKEEAEFLAMAKNIYKELNIPAKIYVTNKKLINEILVDKKIVERDREKVIRELVNLDKLSKEEVAKNLKEIGAEKLVEIFTAKEKTFEKYRFYEEIRKLKDLCSIYGVEVEFRPFLARGLSYYNGTVFEIWAEESGIVLSGGGSYLVDGIQSSGISFCLEPLFLISKEDYKNNTMMILSISQDKQAINIAQKLREKNIPVVLLTDKSSSKALDYANAKKIDRVLIIGEEEVKNKRYTLKNMKTGKEQKLSESEILEEIN